MVLKLTASVLLGLMMVVTATSQAGVRYCLCLQTILIGDCACHELVSPEKRPGKGADAGGCCECTAKGGSIAVEKQEAENPLGNDCCIKLTVEINDFTTSGGLEFSAKFSPTPVLISSPSSEIGIPAVVRNCSLNQTRGPPRLSVVPSVPLFLRHSVFLV